MKRGFVTTLVLALTAAGVAVADEFQAIITKVENGKVTYNKVKGRNEDGKTEYDEAKTLPITKGVKVVKAKFDMETKKMVNGDPLEGGLKNDAFTELGTDKRKGLGVLATLITSADNKSIAQIRVLSLKIKIK